MLNLNEIVGDDGANTMFGTTGDDLIYGFDPNGPQANVATIAATRVASGLSAPVYAGAAPGDAGRLFVVELGGRIQILDLRTGQTASTPFLDVSAQIATGGEQGLLGLAFHPDYAANGRFYVNLINTAGDTEIREYRVSGANPSVADPDSSRLVLTVDQPAGRTNHKAGWLGFGEDGQLYVPTGDGGGTGDPDNLAQNTASLLGKVLRIDVDRDGFPTDPSRNYAIPSDNPFVGRAGADEIWASGLRNPYRDSFDRATGELYIADVGQNAFEEIDLGAAGANYGWRRYEGPAPYDPATGPSDGGVSQGLSAPLFSYAHASGAGRSITGGYVYRGPSDALQGQYVFADFVSDKVFTLRGGAGSATATERTGQIVYDAGRLTSPSSFGEDADGNLYVVSIGGEIWRLDPQTSSADLGDTIDAREGNDRVFGGSGNDRLSGGSGENRLFGMAGNDILVDLDGGDSIDGGPGTDVLVFDRQFGTVGFGLDARALADGFTTFDGTFVRNIERLAAHGGAGDDFLRGAELADGLAGGNGRDELLGRGGPDVLSGDNGDDVLVGGEGADTAQGGAGRDWIQGDAGDDLLIGNEDADEVHGNAGADAIWAGDGADILAGEGGDDALYGGDGDDYLTGDDGNDILIGEAGDDELVGGAGTDFMSGGAGADRFRFQLASDSTGANLDIVASFETGLDILDLTRLGANRNDLRVDPFNGRFAIVSLDQGNDGLIEFAVQVNGSVSASDILL